MAIRIALKQPQVLAATGWSSSTLWSKIAEGKFPAPVKTDPDARAVHWWEDEVEAVQQAATERRDQESSQVAA
jgi:predicted DNA-binding transcriptional regulator AlpA